MHCIYFFFVSLSSLLSPQISGDIGPSISDGSQSSSSWAGALLGDDEDVSAGGNRRTILKWETDEALGAGATISAVLYVNLNFPALRKEYPGNFYSFTFLIMFS